MSAPAAAGVKVAVAVAAAATPDAPAVKVKVVEVALSVKVRVSPSSICTAVSSAPVIVNAWPTTRFASVDIVSAEVSPSVMVAVASDAADEITYGGAEPSAEIVALKVSAASTMLSSTSETVKVASSEFAGKVSSAAVVPKSAFAVAVPSASVTRAMLAEFNCGEMPTVKVAVPPSVVAAPAVRLKSEVAVTRTAAAAGLRAIAAGNVVRANDKSYTSARDGAKFTVVVSSPPDRTPLLFASVKVKAAEVALSVKTTVSPADARRTSAPLKAPVRTLVPLPATTVAGFAETASRRSPSSSSVTRRVASAAVPLTSTRPLKVGVAVTVTVRGGSAMSLSIAAGITKVAVFAVVPSPPAKLATVGAVTVNPVGSATARTTGSGSASLTRFSLNDTSIVTVLLAAASSVRVERGVPLSVSISSRTISSLIVTTVVALALSTVARFVSALVSVTLIVSPLSDAASTTTPTVMTPEVMPAGTVTAVCAPKSPLMSAAVAGLVPPPSIV